MGTLPRLAGLALGILTCAAQEDELRRDVFPYATRRQWNLPGETIDWSVPTDVMRPVAVLTRDASVHTFDPSDAAAPWHVVRTFAGEGRGLTAGTSSWFVVTARPDALHRLPFDGSATTTLPLPFEPTHLAIATRAGRSEWLGVLGKHEEFSCVQWSETGFSEIARDGIPAGFVHDLVGGLDGDGEPYFVFANGASRELVRWSAEHATNHWALDRLPRTLRLANDSLLVCAGTPRGADQVIWARWNEERPERLATFESSGPVTIDAMLRDVNGDGRLDLSFLNFGHNQLERRLRLPSGAFGPPATWYAGQLPEHLALRDLDGDGFPEWLLLSPSVRVLSALPNRGGTPVMPQRLVAARTPTLFVRGESNDTSGMLYDEGDAAFVSWEGDRVQRHVLPGASIDRAARFPTTAERVLAHDRARSAWLRIELLDTASIHSEKSCGASEPLGPVRCGEFLWFGSRGASVLERASWEQEEPALELPFEVAHLLTSPDRDTLHVVGRSGEFATWHADELTLGPVRSELAHADSILVLKTHPLQLVFTRRTAIVELAERPAGQLEPSRPIVLSSAPTALATVPAPSGSRIVATCPAAHTVDLVDLSAGVVMALGAGLHPRDVITRVGATSTEDHELLVLCTFSGEVLSLRPMEHR